LPEDQAPLPEDEAPSPINYDFEIDVIDIYSLATTASISRSADSTSASEALVLNGYLGSTPTFPSLAVSLNTLELLYIIRLRKASFSIEAYAKVVSDLYAVCIPALSIGDSDLLFV
jgi:hypothetical protein